ncbi:unnamed protein product, partial [Ascophyllum nodosum]
WFFTDNYHVGDGGNTSLRRVKNQARPSAAALGAPAIASPTAMSMFEPKVTAFPAKEGEAWVDPPLFRNPQIDVGSWEEEVILNDSQKPHRAKFPMPLHDPDMTYGTLATPRRTLKILRTEAQQENTHIVERTRKRQMALEKQKRLRDAAYKTGYTINTLGEGK